MVLTRHARRRLSCGDAPTDLPADGDGNGAEDDSTTDEHLDTPEGVQQQGEEDAGAAVLEPQQLQRLLQQLRRADVCADPLLLRELVKLLLDGLQPSVRAEWLVLLPDVYDELAASCSKLGPGNDYEPATCSSGSPSDDELKLDALLAKAVGGPVGWLCKPDGNRANHPPPKNIAFLVRTPLTPRQQQQQQPAASSQQAQSHEQIQQQQGQQGEQQQQQAADVHHHLCLVLLHDAESLCFMACSLNSSSRNIKAPGRTILLHLDPHGSRYMGCCSSLGSKPCTAEAPAADSAAVFVPILAYLQRRIRKAAQEERGSVRGPPTKASRVSLLSGPHLQYCRATLPPLPASCWGSSGTGGTGGGDGSSAVCCCQAGALVLLDWMLAWPLDSSVAGRRAPQTGLTYGGPVGLLDEPANHSDLLFTPVWFPPAYFSLLQHQLVARARWLEQQQQEQQGEEEGAEGGSPTTLTCRELAHLLLMPPSADRPGPSLVPRLPYPSPLGHLQLCGRRVAISPSLQPVTFNSTLPRWGPARVQTMITHAQQCCTLTPQAQQQRRLAEGAVDALWGTVSAAGAGGVLAVRDRDWREAMHPWERVNMGRVAMAAVSKGGVQTVVVRQLTTPRKPGPAAAAAAAGGGGGSPGSPQHPPQPPSPQAPPEGPPEPGPPEPPPPAEPSAGDIGAEGAAGDAGADGAAGGVAAAGDSVGAGPPAAGASAAAAGESTDKAADEAGSGDAAAAEATSGHAAADARIHAGPVRRAAAHRTHQRQLTGDTGATVGSTGGDDGAAASTAAAGQKLPAGAGAATAAAAGVLKARQLRRQQQGHQHKLQKQQQQQQADQGAPGAVGTSLLEGAVGGAPGVDIDSTAANNQHHHQQQQQLPLYPSASGTAAASAPQPLQPGAAAGHLRLLLPTESQPGDLPAADAPQQRSTATQQLQQQQQQHTSTKKRPAAVLSSLTAATAAAPAAAAREAAALDDLPAAAQERPGGSGAPPASKRLKLLHPPAHPQQQAAIAFAAADGADGGTACCGAAAMAGAADRSRLYGATAAGAGDTRGPAAARAASKQWQQGPRPGRQQAAGAAAAGMADPPAAPAHRDAAAAAAAAAAGDGCSEQRLVEAAAAAAVGAGTAGVNQGVVEGVCLAQDRAAAAAAAGAGAGAAGPHSPTTTAVASVWDSTSPPPHPLLAQQQPGRPVEHEASDDDQLAQQSVGRPHVNDRMLRERAPKARDSHMEQTRRDRQLRQEHEVRHMTARDRQDRYERAAARAEAEQQAESPEVASRPRGTNAAAAVGRYDACDASGPVGGRQGGLPLGLGESVQLQRELQEQQKQYLLSRLNKPVRRKAAPQQQRQQQQPASQTKLQQQRQPKPAHLKGPAARKSLLLAPPAAAPAAAVVGAAGPAAAGTAAQQMPGSKRLKPADAQVVKTKKPRGHLPPKQLDTLQQHQEAQPPGPPQHQWQQQQQQQQEQLVGLPRQQQQQQSVIPAGVTRRAVYQQHQQQLGPGGKRIWGLPLMKRRRQKPAGVTTGRVHQQQLPPHRLERHQRVGAPVMPSAAAAGAGAASAADDPAAKAQADRDRLQAALKLHQQGLLPNRFRRQRVGSPVVPSAAAGAAAGAADDQTLEALQLLEADLPAALPAGQAAAPKALGVQQQALQQCAPRSRGLAGAGVNRAGGGAAAAAAGPGAADPLQAMVGEMHRILMDVTDEKFDEIAADVYGEVAADPTSTTAAAAPAADVVAATAAAGRGAARQQRNNLELLKQAQAAAAAAVATAVAAAGNVDPNADTTEALDRDLQLRVAKLLASTGPAAAAAAAEHPAGVEAAVAAAGQSCAHHPAGAMLLSQPQALQLSACAAARAELEGGLAAAGHQQLQGLTAAATAAAAAEASKAEHHQRPRGLKAISQPAMAQPPAPLLQEQQEQQQAAGAGKARQQPSPVQPVDADVLEQPPVDVQQQQPAVRRRRRLMSLHDSKLKRMTQQLAGLSHPELLQLLQGHTAGGAASDPNLLAAACMELRARRVMQLGAKRRADREQRAVRWRRVLVGLLKQQAPPEPSKPSKRQRRIAAGRYCKQQAAR